MNDFFVDLLTVIDAVILLAAIVYGVVKLIDKDYWKGFVILLLIGILGQLFVIKTVLTSSQ